MKPRITLFYGLLLLLCPLMIIQAQSSCPTVVSDAVARLSRACSRVGRNEICYGNATLNVQPQAGVTDLHFNAPGDVESITRIASLALSRMNVNVPEWGIALLKAQANLPNGLPGQNVTMLLFGNVQMTPTGGGATPMQAFIFASGINDGDCAEAPNSGVLIQTPKGSAELELQINGVRVWLNSTAYVTAQPGGSLAVYLVEGRGRVGVFDAVRLLPAGTFITVPLDGGGMAAAQPSEPLAYDMGTVQRLNYLLRMLPQRVSPVAPLDMSVCQAIAYTNANARQGPGTNYRSANRVRTGTIQPVTSTATGTDGQPWVQLADGRWVQQSAITTAGACGGVPVVIAPPINDNPNRDKYYAMMFHLNACIPPAEGINAGDTLSVSFGCCGTKTIEEQQQLDPTIGAPVLILDGVNIPLVISDIFLATDMNWYGRSATGRWTATPGTHTVTATWWVGSLTCSFSVP